MTDRPQLKRRRAAATAAASSSAAADEATTPLVRSVSKEEKSRLPINSVFRIEVAKCRKNWRKPWQPSKQSRSSGSGFAIRYQLGSEEKLGILTNAHVVNDAVLIHVIRVGSTKLERATVVECAKSTDLDLALLSIESNSFWEQAMPLDLSPKLPSLFSDVMVVGFPSGGKQVCVTKGVVSRVTTQLFAVDGFPSPSQLAVQIDAAINPGNSGGPALNPIGNTCYGVAALKSTHAGHDNVGYIIPSLTVLKFLSDLREHSKFCGVIDPGFHFAQMENQALRKRHCLPPDGPDGVLVTGVKSFSHAAGQLEVGDVIVEIDNCKVGSDGTVAVLKDCELGTTHLLKLSFLFSRKRNNDEITLKLLRRDDTREKREKRRLVREQEEAEEEREEANGTADGTDAGSAKKRRAENGGAVPAAAAETSALAKKSDAGAASGSSEGSGSDGGARFAKGDDVMHTPPVLWRWESEVNQIPHRVTIVRVNTPRQGSDADDGDADAATDEPGGAGKRKRKGKAKTGEGEQEQAGGQSASLSAAPTTTVSGERPRGVVSYDVLDRVTDTITRCVLEEHLAPLEEWQKDAPARSEVEVTLQLKTFPVLRSVRQHQEGASLSYFMVGGIAFINQVWAGELRKSGGSSYMSYPPVCWRPRANADDQQVLLAEIFQHECNFGYSVSRHGGLLRYVNGVPIKNLAHLKETCESVAGGFLEFETSSGIGPVVLDVDACRKAEKELLKKCNMQTACSADLL